MTIFGYFCIVAIGCFLGGLRILLVLLTKQSIICLVKCCFTRSVIVFFGTENSVNGGFSCLVKICQEKFLIE